jgi:hypothetical protein
MKKKEMISEQEYGTYKNDSDYRNYFGIFVAFNALCVNNPPNRREIGLQTGVPEGKREGKRTIFVRRELARTGLT